MTLAIRFREGNHANGSRHIRQESLTPETTPTSH